MNQLRKEFRLSTKFHVKMINFNMKILLILMWYGVMSQNAMKNHEVASPIFKNDLFPSTPLRHYYKQQYALGGNEWCADPRKQARFKRNAESSEERDTFKKSPFARENKPRGREEDGGGERRPYNDRGGDRGGNRRPYIDRGDNRRQYGDRGGDRRAYGDRGGDRRPYGDRGGDRRAYGDRGGDRRAYGDRGGDRRSYGDRGGERRSYGDRGGDRRSYGDRGGDRRSYGDRGGDRRAYGDRGGDRRSYGDRGGDRRSYGDRGGDRRSYGDRGGDRRAYGDRGGDRKPYGDRGGDRKPYGDRGGDRRPYGDRGGDRRSYGDRGGDRRSYGDRGGDRRSYGDRGGGRPYDNRQAGGRSYNNQGGDRGQYNRGDDRRRSYRREDGDRPRAPYARRDDAPSEYNARKQDHDDDQRNFDRNDNRRKVTNEGPFRENEDDYGELAPRLGKLPRDRRPKNERPEEDKHEQGASSGSNLTIYRIVMSTNRTRKGFKLRATATIPFDESYFEYSSNEKRHADGLHSSSYETDLSSMKGSFNLSSEIVDEPTTVTKTTQKTAKLKITKSLKSAEESSLSSSSEDYVPEDAPKHKLKVVGSQLDDYSSEDDYTKEKSAYHQESEYSDDIKTTKGKLSPKLVSRTPKPKSQEPVGEDHLPKKDAKSKPPLKTTHSKRPKTPPEHQTTHKKDAGESSSIDHHSDKSTEESRTSKIQIPEKVSKRTSPPKETTSHKMTRKQEGTDASSYSSDYSESDYTAEDSTAHKATPKKVGTDASSYSTDYSKNDYSVAVKSHLQKHFAAHKVPHKTEGTDASSYYSDRTDSEYTSTEEKSPTKQPIKPTPKKTIQKDPIAKKTSKVVRKITSKPKPKKAHETSDETDYEYDYSSDQESPKNNKINYNHASSSFHSRYDDTDEYLSDDMYEINDDYAQKKFSSQKYFYDNHAFVFNTQKHQFEFVHYSSLKEMNLSTYLVDNKITRSQRPHKTTYTPDRRYYARKRDKFY